MYIFNAYENTASYIGTFKTIVLIYYSILNSFEVENQFGEKKIWNLGSHESNEKWVKLK